MTHIASCKNVIRIEHAASDIFVAFLPVLLFREKIESYTVYLKRYTQNYIIFKIPASGLFLKYF